MALRISLIWATSGATIEARLPILSSTPSTFPKEIHMLRRTVMLLLAVLTAPTVLAQSEDFGKWKSLFNGKDVSGWVTAKKNHGKNVWKVDGGTLTNGKDGANNQNGKNRVAC